MLYNIFSKAYRELNPKLIVVRNYWGYAGDPFYLVVRQHEAITLHNGSDDDDDAHTVMDLSMYDLNIVLSIVDDEVKLFKDKIARAKQTNYIGEVRYAVIEKVMSIFSEDKEIFCNYITYLQINNQNLGAKEKATAIRKLLDM